MGNIISNEGYEGIEVGREVSGEVEGRIVYGNEFSGIGEVGMGEDLGEVVNCKLGRIGNNVVVEVEGKMGGYGNGGWYVDSRDGVI